MKNTLSKGQEDRMTYNELYERAGKPGFSDFVEESIRKGTMFPEITAQKNYIHNPNHHPEGSKEENGEIVPGTVLDHTLAALRDYHGNNPLVNMAILFHDFGKPMAAAPSENGNYHRFYNHDDIGAERFPEFAERNGIPKEHQDVFLFVIQNHMRFHHISEMKKKKIRKLKASPFWNILKKVSYHDDHCRKWVFRKEAFRENIIRAKGC